MNLEDTVRMVESDAQAHPQRFTLDDDEIAAEKRDCALHEAAHVVLTREFGGDARGHIWPNPEGIPVGEKAWLGTTYIWVQPGVFSGITGRIAPPDALAIIGLAGIAAEVYCESEDQEAALFDLRAMVAFGALSETDKALVGDDPPLSLFENTVAHVASNWKRILAVAAELEDQPDMERPSYLT